MRRSRMIFSAVLFMLSFSGAAANCPRAHCHYLPFGMKSSATPSPTPLPPTATAQSTPTPSSTPTLTPTPSSAPTLTPTSISVPAPTPTASATPNSRISWSIVAEAPVSRSEGQGVAVDGLLYVFGGYTDNTYTPKSLRADMYNPRTDKWTRLPDMPMAITHAGTATDGANIYLAGGVVGSGAGDILTATTAVWRYNVATKQWSSMPALPEPRGAGELALIGRNLHFFSGTGLNRYVSEDEHWVLALDGGTQWVAAAALPNPRNHLADAVIGGKLYVIGGQHGHNETLVTQRSVHVYDPALNSWTERAPLPAGRSHIGGATVVRGELIYIFGGEEEHAISQAEVFVYNTRTNTWSRTTPLPIPRHSGIATIVGNTIIYTGGSLERITYKGVLTP